MTTGRATGGGRRPRPLARAVGTLALLALLGACGAGASTGTGHEGHADPPAAGEGDAAGSDGGHDGHHGASGAAGSAGEAAPERPLRKGETRTVVTMAEPYTPSAPTGVGTDDYRCFVLDPGLTEPAFLTGTDVLPGNPDAVHHVILFHVPPEYADDAAERDEEEDGPGWTCFGDAGISSDGGLDDAPWLAAWAPGGREQVLAPGLGIPMEAGSQVVMQVHYNLLAGPESTREDVSSTRLRLAPGDADVTPLQTVLFPAPVELPCRPAYDDGSLCERPAALADVKARFGEGPGSTADFLHLLCASPVDPGPVQRCTRPIGRPMTVRGAAGHMHLLGQSLTITANPGTSRERTLLRIPRWDFDNQAATPTEPVRLRAGDRVQVTCRHSQRLRDDLPAFEGQPDRYVVWGDGTTDEMCLGILQAV